MMKQTEIGLIPDDWEVIKFGDKVDIFRGGSPRPIERYITTNAYGINWIKIGDVRPNDKYIRQTEEKIIPEGKSRSREVKKGDFILSNSMSFGRPYILNIDGCIHDGWLTIQNYSESFDKEFLYYLLGSDEVFKQYVQMAAGSSVQNLNKEKVADLQLKVPPLAEQRRIAKALSDVDALISTTEKLIQKKKNIKQGTMQNLLTGKKRLPGFGPQTKSPAYKQTELGPIPEDWEVKSLGESFDIGSSKRVFQSQWRKSGIPFYRAREIVILAEKNTVENELFIDETLYNQYKTLYGVPAVNDLLVTGVGTLGKVYKVQNTNPFYYKDGNIICLKNKGAINSDYVRYHFDYYIVKDQINDNSGKSTVGTYTINSARKTIIPVPSLPEQTAIATVLSSMDKEMETLNTKLEKYRNLKTAMMQQLLTGKIRLVK